MAEYFSMIRNCQKFVGSRSVQERLKKKKKLRGRHLLYDVIWKIKLKALTIRERISEHSKVKKKEKAKSNNNNNNKTELTARSSFIKKTLPDQH